VNNPDEIIKHLKRVLEDNFGFVQCEAEAAMEIVEELQSELAKYKMTWKTGKIPRDGWYWVRYKNDAGNWRLPRIYHVGTHYITLLEQWSGPIPKPEEKS
jgi:hypothetical protein